MTGDGPIRVALLWLALSVAASIWILIDHRPPEWDHANHLERAVDCYRNLRIVADSGTARDPRGLVLLPAGGHVRGRVCSTSLFPIAPLTAQAVMMVFLGPRDGVRLRPRAAGSPTRRPACGRRSSSPPRPSSSSRSPISSSTFLWPPWWRWRSTRSCAPRSFADTRWSLALGLVCGLGMLTKPPFAIYVAPSIALEPLARRASIRPSRGGSAGPGPLSPSARCCRCPGTARGSSACPCRSSTARSSRPPSSRTRSR